MKQFLVLLFSGCITFCGNAQNAVPPASGGSGLFKPSNDQLAKMSQVLPPAPNAVSIARYGGVNVDLSTGAIQKVIELKPMVDKDLSVSIGLNYTSNGLRVNDYPSRVGMGWTMNAGGQISRVIRGGDDFFAQRYLPTSNIEPNESDAFTTTYCWQSVNNGPRDAEPDMFSFNFGGYSGKFVFDHDGSILSIPASSLKISYNANANPTYNFLITTPDGIKYYFGNASAIEETKFGSNSTFNLFKPNVWNLTKISHPNGYEISLNYERKLIGPYLVGVTETHFKLSPDASVPVCYTDYITQTTYCVDGMIPNSYNQNSYMSAFISLLKEIKTSTGAKALFTYSEQGYPENIVTNITYFNEKNEQLQKYEFGYDFVNNSTSAIPFLKSIKEKNAMGAVLNSGHEFGYFNLDNIPARFNLSQDHWGFYNGKINTTLVAKPDEEEQALKFPISTANRDPDQSYVINGLLKTISYPTKGKDEIFYESNTVIRQKDMNTYATKYQSITGSSNSSFNESSGVFFNIAYENKIRITMQCTYLGTGSFDSLHDKGLVRIVNASTNQIVYEQYFLPNLPMQIEFVSFPSASYKLVVSSRGLFIRTDASVRHREGLVANMQDINESVGGVRVQKAVSTDGVTSVPMVKRYYYGSFNNLYYSSAAPVPVPQYYTPFRFNSGFAWGTGCNLSYKTYAHEALHCSSLTRSILYDGRLVAYTSVLESIGGENFESGAIEHKFNHVNDITAQRIRGWYNLDAPQTNSSYLSKGEYETNSYSKKGGSLVMVSSVSTETTIDTRRFKEVSCYNIHTSGDLPCALFNYNNEVVGPDPLHHSVFHINKYYIASAWKYISKQTSKQFDDNGQNPLTVVTDYFYDDDRNLMLTREQVNNSKGELVKRVSKYPHDFLSSPVYSEMVNRNMISPIVEETVYKPSLISNNGELSKTRINYEFGQTNTNINPVSIQKSFLGNVLETQSKIDLYDEKGNILQTTDKAGIITSYIYGYNKQYPVAKIIGKTYYEAVLQSQVSVDTLNNTTTSASAMMAELDKIQRLTNCLVSTFTYKPMVGMISEKDPNGKSKYYEYDYFNRLAVIRDQDNNVVQKYCYNYAGQAENCNTPCLNTTSIWRNTNTALRCQSIGCSFTGYQEQEQMDINPCSATMGQTRWVQAGFNSSVCAVISGVAISSQNYIGAGFTAVYTNTTTGRVYSFTVSQGTTTLGCLPEGVYSISISKPANNMLILFGIGCRTLSGTSAFFGKVSISSTSCNQITIQYDYL